MKDNKEFGKLTSIEDYWKKLNWEFEMLKNNSDNIYYAFNFVITAFHLLDWAEPQPRGTTNQNRQIIKKNIKYLKVCEQLANGAKHFEIDPKRHNSVESMKSEEYVEDGYVEEGYTEDPIIITLSEQEKISILELANSLMLDWKNVLKTKKNDKHLKFPSI